MKYVFVFVFSIIISMLPVVYYISGKYRDIPTTNYNSSPILVPINPADRLGINSTSNSCPLFVTNSSAQEIFRISSDGNIYLRGKLIGKDKELADIFSDAGRSIGGGMK